MNNEEISKKTENIIKHFQKHSNIRSGDVQRAFYLYSKCSWYSKDIEEKLKLIEVICRYLSPDVDDVIAAVLCGSKFDAIPVRQFAECFGEKKYRSIYNQVKYLNDRIMKDAEEASKENANLDRGEYFGKRIMLRVCRGMFEDMMDLLNQKSVSNTVIVRRAYDMAEKAHDGVFRKSGEPYIAHPLRVAIILSDLGMDSSVIAAALLHDVVEDTDHTVADIEKMCGLKIARYVDAVTSVHKEYMSLCDGSKDQYGKAELDELSFQKLVRAVASNKDMIFALYIKAADRMDNLSTIDAVPSMKMHRKKDETLLNYLPLLKAFKLNYFVKKLEDLMWRATDIARYTAMQDKYYELRTRERAHIDEFKKILDMHIVTEVNRYLGCVGYDAEIRERALLPYELYNCIKNSCGEHFAIPADKINKQVVPICDIDIIVDPKSGGATKELFIAGFAKMFNSKVAMTGRTIIDLYDAPENTFVFEVEDHYRNVFRCRIIMREDYGLPKREELECYDGDRLIAEKDSIWVYLDDGETLRLPRGATIIDAAFAIDEDVGYTLRSAKINGNNAEVYSTLLDGDVLSIASGVGLADNIDQAPNYSVRINWLSVVVTNKAKKLIVRYLTEKYEG